MEAVKAKFATEYARRTPRDRQALGRKLLGAAERAGGAAERYVLLEQSAAESAAGGDVAAALRAVELLDESFRVDRRALATQVLSSAAKAAKSPPVAAAFVEAALRLADEHFAADDYAAAAKVIALAEAGARTVKDAGLPSRVKARAKEIREVESHSRKIGPAFKALREDADDPAANLKVGRFLCFVRGDWDRGLPMLAKGSDAALQSLAGQESAAPREPLARVELGNAWWERARSESGTAADRCKQRAALWYNDVESEVDEATRATIRQRLESVRLGRVVDLIKLAATSKDSVSGGWKKQKGDLISDSGAYGRLQFPYQPPAEYDYRIEFTVVRGQTMLGQVFPAAGGALQWGLRTRSVSLSSADGYGYSYGGPGRNLDAPLWFNKRYTMLVKVRRDKVVGYVNGVKAVEADLDTVAAGGRRDVDGAGEVGPARAAPRGGIGEVEFNDGRGWRPAGGAARAGAQGVRLRSDPSVLGVSSDYTQTIFHRIEVVELSGEGTITR